MEGTTTLSFCRVVCYEDIPSRLFKYELYTFVVVSVRILLKMRNVSEKTV